MCQCSKNFQKNFKKAQINDSDRYSISSNSLILNCIGICNPTTNIFVSNTKFCLSLSVACFQTSFAKKLVTPPLSKMYYKNAFHKKIFVSVYSANRVIIPGIGKNSQPNISLRFAHKAQQIKKKSVHLQKKATPKIIFSTRKINFKLAKITF